MKAGFVGCGAGLLAKAMEDAGIEVSWGIDVWDVACKSFQMNFPKAEVINDDIRNLRELPPADLICVTLPCQGFSRATAKKATESGELLFYAWYLLARTGPKYWLFENVPQAEKFMPRFCRCYRLKGVAYGNGQVRSRMFASNFSLPMATGIVSKRWNAVMATEYKGKSGRVDSRLADQLGRAPKVEEALNVMGFEKLKLAGNRCEQLRQIGEGVVYEISYTIGKMLIKLEETGVV